MTGLRNRLNQLLSGKAGAVIFFVALFFIHTPYEINILPGVTVAGQIIQPVAIAFFLFCMVVQSSTVRELFLDNLIFWAFLAWLGVMTIATCRIPGNEWYLGYNFFDLFINPTAIVLLIVVYSKADVRKLIFYLFIFYLIINTINNATALFFHNKGMWNAELVRSRSVLFVGNPNNSVENAIPSIFAGILYCQLYDRKWVYVNCINIVYSIVAALTFSCNVQIVICAAFGVCQIICLIYTKKPGVRKGFGWLNSYVFLIFDILVFDAVVILGNFGWMKAVGMDPRVHGRRELWDTVLERIFDNPVIGSGYTGWIQVFINGKEKWFAHEHSIYLHFAHLGGAVGFAVFLFILLLCVVTVQKLKRFDVRLVFTFLFGFTLLILSIEMYRRTLIFLVLALCCSLARRFREEQVPAQEPYI